MFRLPGRRQFAGGADVQVLFCDRSADWKHWKHMQDGTEGFRGDPFHSLFFRLAVGSTPDRMIGTVRRGIAVEMHCISGSGSGLERWKIGSCGFLCAGKVFGVL